MPPKKVVRANTDYTARFAGELSFQRGDFFYVINERPDGLSFEVINPIEKLRGIVPTSHFDSLDKMQQDAAAFRNYDEIGVDYPQPRDEYGHEGGRGEYVDDGYGHAAPVSAGGSKGERQLWSVLVQRTEQRDDGKWWFTIELKMTDNTSNILFRTYDDFWVLQVSLLNHFPSESGRMAQPRVIPFLPAPTRTMTKEEAHRRRQALDAYLQELIKLPPNVMNSPSVKRFLMVRTGDLDTPLNIRFDPSEALMDLLSDFEEEPDVRIKLILGEEKMMWMEPEYVSFNDLMYHAEERLGFQFEFLLYKDECEQYIPLRGDSDLGLLITTLSKKLTFYVS